LLPQVADRPEPVVSAGLRAAADAGLLVVRDGELRWRHALTCEAVAATALPPERAAVARRAADALLARRGPDDDVRAAALLAGAGEDGRATTLLLRAARRDLARGALRSAEALLDQVPATYAAEAAGDRVVLLTRIGRAADALEAGERALGTATGDTHAELCLLLARAAVRAGQWKRALDYVDRAGRPEDPRTSLLAADATFGAGDVAQAGVLAAEAVAVAERVGAVEPLCEALELVARCAQQDGDLAAAAVAFGRAASVAAEHGLLKQRVEAEFGRGLLAQFEAGWRPALLAYPRELAVEAGMLADVARIDLILADGILTADGPAAAEPVVTACIALTGALRLSSLQAVLQMILATLHAAMGDGAAAQRLVDSALAQPDRAPDVLAHASMVRAFPPLLAGDLARADTLMRAGMQALLEYPAAPPLPYLGLWVLLCAVCGDDDPARGLARRSAGRRRANRAALAYADAVAAGRSGAVEQAAAHYADGDRVGSDAPWWNRLLRMLALHAALADGWAARVDAVGALRADLTEHERLGDHQLARTCRDLLRRAGAPTRRGRGATPVPPALRAAGVTSREMDVLALVAEGRSNAEVAERLFLSPRTVETHVANLLAKTGSANRAQLRALTP
jgi:DNA-binding CsgD family transcriptional regulator/tetratricopeptide (TPR) repeat protein